MAGAMARRVERADGSALTMASKFSKYKPEEEKIVRKVEVVEDATLKRIKEAWNAFRYNEDGPGASYKCAMKAIKALECSASDVEKFSLALVEFEKDDNFPLKAGFFLSALINNGKDIDYVVRTAHLAVPIHFLGYQNMKSITVEGDAGGRCGWKMTDGSIMVKGDAGMQCGACMRGGSIIVKGDASARCGELMEGGVIHVDGEIESITENLKGGKIYEKGKLACGTLLGWVGEAVRRMTEWLKQ